MHIERQDVRMQTGVKGLHQKRITNTSNWAGGCCREKEGFGSVKSCWMIYEDEICMSLKVGCSPQYSTKNNFPASNIRACLPCTHTQANNIETRIVLVVITV